MKKLSVLSAFVVLTSLPMFSFAQSQSCSSGTYKFDDNAKINTVAAQDKSGNCVTDTPTGLSGNDLADFNHLSEGSDVYPYEWFMSLKSFSFADPDGNKTVPFAARLDKNFGFMRSNTLESVKLVNGKEKKIKYLVPYVGLTSSWSSQRTDNTLVDRYEDLSHSADAFAEYESSNGTMISEKNLVKNVIDINGKNVKSIRMIGTNCSLCHSGALTYSKDFHTSEEFRVQGAPGIVNMRAFFRDLIASTLVMFVKGDRMEEFLADMKAKNPLTMKHIQPKAMADEVKDYFCREVALASKDRSFLGNTLLNNKFTCIAPKLLTFLRAAKLADRERLYHARDAVRRSFELLIRRTYNIGDKEDIGNLTEQIRFMSSMGTGMKPPMEETIPGFNRTDAFGRISNLVLRGENPVDNNAPVSLPWIWGLKYMGNLHYNSNSNSVILRNVGQALGLGAVIINKDLDTNVNVHNLDRLEHLVHKIQVPEWSKVFKTVLDKDSDKYRSEFEIDMQADRLKNGYEVYKTQCMSCHESNKFVGPANSLREYTSYPLQGSKYDYSPNTDAMAARNAVIPVKTYNEETKTWESFAFETKIFNDVSKIKARYYSQYKISEEEQAKMEFRLLRGFEFFRDTLLGSAGPKNGNDYGQIAVGSGYKARHLSGVWATSPYLHNGSVPNMWLLLTKDTLRPKNFNVYSNEFDPATLGLKKWNRAKGADGLEIPCNKKDPTEEHICFATSEKGNSNMGHNWGTELSDDNKKDLINFLKYLPPEPEYAWESQSTY